ncbi:MAG: 2TM domain-containing protein [Limnohabitans sp.]|nr:2TM domain-containing protein [Limnohabitans sp.]
MENIDNSEFERYQRAKKRVDEIKGFYGHLTSYICVMLFFVFINLKYSPEHIWFFWPMSGWGIGLFFHGARVFNLLSFLGKDWEERKIQEFLEEEKRNQNKYQ